MGCRRVIGTNEARQLSLVRLISASLTVLTHLRHDVEERARRTSHCTAPSTNYTVVQNILGHYNLASTPLDDDLFEKIFYHQIQW